MNTNIIRVPTSSLSMLESDTGNSAGDVDPWLFAETPGSYAEHLDAHVRGTVFEGATIRKVVPYTMEDAAQHFTAMTEDDSVESVTAFLKGGTINLKTKGFSVAISDLVKPTKGAKYALVNGVLIKYRPLMGTFAQGSPVTIRLLDSGMLGDTPPTVTFSKTIGANILMGLSYPIPLKNLKDLKLTVEVGATGTIKGRAWGSIEMAFHLQFSSKPLTQAMTPSKVQYEFGSDIFEIQARDPRLFNAVLSQADLERMRAIEQDIPGARSASFEMNGTLARNASRSSSVDSESSTFGGRTITDDQEYLRTDPFSLGTSQGQVASAIAPAVAVPPRITTPFQESAASRVRGLGFHVARELPSIAATSENGLFSMLSAVAPALQLAGPGNASALSEQQRTILAPYLGSIVYLRVDEEDPSRSIVRRNAFPGSYPMTLAALFGLMGDITFH